MRFWQRLGRPSRKEVAAFLEGADQKTIVVDPLAGRTSDIEMFSCLDELLADKQARSLA